MSSATRGVTLAMYLVPALATFVVGGLLIRSRLPTGTGARIHGGPPGEDAVLAWRVVANERGFGVDVPLRGARLRLEASDGPFSVTVAGQTDEHGAWEARVPLDSTRHGRLRVAVRLEPSGKLLALGEVPVHPQAWESAVTVKPARLSGRATGALLVGVSAARGAVAASYPEKIQVDVSRRATLEPVAGAAVRVQGEWVEVEAGQGARTDEKGRASLRVRAGQHYAKIEVTAELSDTDRGTWEGFLPVLPGALWLDPSAWAEGRLVVVSPVKHANAFLTLFQRNARRWGTRIALVPDSLGGARGQAPLPPAVAGPSWLLVSPDPPGYEAEFVAWPVPATGATERPRAEEPMAAASLRTPMLLDGMVIADAAIRRRTHLSRARSLALIGAAALIEAVLLFVRARQASREIEALIAANPEVDDALARSMRGGGAFWLKLLVAMVVIAAGFLGLAFLSWFGAA